MEKTALCARKRRASRFIRLLLSGFLALPLAVYAHPHSFIDMQTTLVTQQQQLTGLKMVWTMDEITSADLLYDAQKAQTDSDIWKKLAAEVMARVLSKHYFTDFYRDGKPVKYLDLPSNINCRARAIRP